MMVKALVRKFWKPLLAVLATCALGIAVMVGMSGGCLSLQRSTEDYLASHHYYDASITTEVTAENMVDDLLSVEGVSRVNARMVANTVMIGPSQRILSIRAMTYRPNDWQRFVVWDSVQAKGRDSVMLECEFAQDNGIKAGDEVRIRVDGSYRTYLVEALVTAPESLSMRALENQSPHNSDFGAVYVPVSLVARETNHEYEDAKQELEQRGSELGDAQVQARQTYDQALEDLRGARSELERRTQEAREALAMLAAARAALNEKEGDIHQGLAELASRESELDQARDRLEQVRAGLREALDEANKAMDALERQRADIAAAIARAQATIEELPGRIAMLEQAQQALSDIDASVAEAKDLAKKLESDQIKLLMRILGEMDPDTKLSDLASDAAALDDFRALCEKYGFAPNVSGTIHEMAESLLRAIDTVEADCQLLRDPSMLELAKRIQQGDEAARESKEGKELARTVQRYTGMPITEDSMQLATERCQQLLDLVAQSDLRTWAEQLLALTDYTYEDWLNLLMGIDGYAEKLRAALGDDYPQIATTGQLVAAYDTLPKAIDSALAQLEAKRAQVVSELADAGIKEDELPHALEQLRAAKQEAQDGLAQLEAALSKIDEGLEELRAGKEDLDANATQTEGGLEQLDSAARDVDALQDQALDALASLDDARSELDGQEAQAREGMAALNELSAQLASRRLDAESQWVQGLLDFSNLRYELERARAELGPWEGYEAFHNQFLIWFDEGADHDQTLAAACDALDSVGVKSSFSYEDSPVKTRLDDNVVPLRTLSYYIPALFFGIVLMVTFLFMSLMVRQSRANIGIMRALGKSVWQVRIPYCTIGLLVSIGAILPGLALGWAVVSYTAGYYSDFFKLPSFTSQFDGAMVAWALALTIVVVQAATIVGTTLIATIQPSEALSRTAPTLTRIPRAVHALTARLDELAKFGVLSLLRNPLRVGFSVVCVAASVAIIFAAQAFIASKNYLVHQEFDMRLAYDCQVFFSEDPDEQTLEELGELDYVRDLQRVGYYACTIYGNDSEQSATVDALPADSDLVGIYDAHGQRLAVPEHGIVLDDHLAAELGVGVGDTVMVQDAPLRVEALSHQDSNRVQYVSLETMSRLGEPSIGCIICRIDPADQQRLMRALSERDDYVLAVFTDVLRRSTERLHATYDLSAWILTIFAVIIGSLVVFNVMQANMLERKRELCVLRTLGFGHGELSRGLLWQTMLYVGLACAVGLPAGRLVALRALEIISTPDRTFAYASGPMEYAVTITIVLLLAVVSHMIAMRGMRAWDINEGVKDKE